MLGLIAFGAVGALAQPVNDYFTNAIAISNLVGQVTGDNTNATLEPGEPLTVVSGDHGLIPRGSTVWYQWTAPASGNINFNTEGSSFDTVLAIYTGTSISNLSLVVADDDSGGNLTSLVTLSAVQGTVYYISVGGYGSFGNTQGALTLNWGVQNAVSGGEFRFTSANYVYSQNDSAGATDNRGLMIAPLPRATITRVKGAVGMIDVSYIVTNTFYTNIYRTNFYGTNILSWLVDTNGVKVLGSDTNSFFTNAVVSLDKQNYQDGQFIRCASFLPGYTSTFTNFVVGGITNVIGTTSNILLTNFSFAFYCDKTNAPIATNAVSVTGGTNIFITTLFCTNVYATNVIPSARPGVDYFPISGVLTFNDYQMNQDIFVLNQNAPTPNMVNPLVIVQVTNVFLDPLEDQSIPVPTLDTNRSTAYLTFLNTQVDRFAPCGTQPTASTILNLERSVIQCDESVVGSHVARIGVLRTGTNFSAGASVQWRIDHAQNDGELNTFPLQPGSDYATPPNAAAFSSNVDFTYTGGTLNWGANDAQVKYIDVNINDDNIVEFNEDFQLELYGFSGASTGLVNTATVTILYDSTLSYNLTTGFWTSGEQPAGALDRSYNPDNDQFTSPHPFNAQPGANGTVYATRMQPDGNLLIGGDFTGYNTEPRSRIARILANGMLDENFDAGNVNGYVAALVLDSTGTKILAGGGFTAVNGNSANHIVQLNSDGSVDGAFNPTGAGASDLVKAVAVQPDGKIVISGYFTQYNNTNRNYIARLNVDGSLDDTFDPGVGPDAVVHSVAIDSSGRIVIGGEFTTVDGVARNGVARLNSDGSLDATFAPANDPSIAVNPVVYAVAVQADGKVLVGGSFVRLGYTGGQNLARLNSADGSVDGNFDIGGGFDDTIFSITLQSDGQILLGGFFTYVNQVRRVGLARLNMDGSVDTTFLDTAYNQFAGLPNPYHDQTVNGPNVVNSIALQADGNVIIGGSFAQVGGGFTRDDIHVRNNVARLVGGGTPGPGNITLTYSNYTADASVLQSFVTVTRTNGTLGPAGATVVALPLASGPGAAVYGTDYLFTASTPVWGVSWSRPTWMLSDGLSGANNYETAINGVSAYSGFNNVFVNIISNNNANTSLNLALTQPNGTDLFFLGGTSTSSANGAVSADTAEGENIPLGVALGRRIANMTIVHNNVHPGTFVFGAPVYYVAENGVTASVNVIRTGGSDGLVTVKCATTTGGTAVPGTDYTVTTNTLTFQPNITNQVFSFHVINNTIAQPDRTVNVRLYGPTSGATVAAGTSNAIVVIVDDDYAPGHVSFDSATYGVNENSGTAQVNVIRLGGNSGTLTALVAVTNGTAINGVNFTGLTNLLTWTNSDVSVKVVSIPILDDGVVTSNLVAKLQLYNGTVNTTNSALALGGAFTNATLTITNTDSIGTVGFTAASYAVNENGGSAFVPVIRTGGSAQTITVNFSTSPGTALSGTDFNSTNGTLVFGPGEVSKVFRVPIIDNGFQDGNRFLSLSLSNAAPANGLGSPSLALLNIVDDETYNEPAGDPDVTFSSSAGFNDSVFALAQQSNGQILAGGDFTTANSSPRQRIARLNLDGTLDTKFSSYLAGYGANATVRTIAVQTDGRILVGGFFTNFNNTPVKRIARLNYDGSLDSSFVVGSGVDNPVYTVKETFVNGQRRILLGGAFTTVAGVARNAIAQLLDTGSLDTGFNPGLGANGTVYAIGVQTDGKIVIGGDFTTVGGAAVNHLARLNADGSVDATFNIGTGASSSVHAVQIQLDGRILIGGAFTNFNGAVLNHIARLNANGSVDNTFTPGVGANDNVEAIALQTDTRIVLGGEFTRCNGVTRNSITRLNPDGTVDPTINFGAGADGSVAAVIMQEGTLQNAAGNIPDEKIIIGGGFLNYDSEAHPHVARIYGGARAGSGTFEFTTSIYNADETSSNVVVTVRRLGGTSGPNADGSGNVGVTFSTSAGTAVPGINYSQVNTNLTFSPGEVFQTINIPLMDDQVVTPDLTVNLTLSNPLTPSGLGPIPIATLFILNDDSTINFSSSAYSVPKNTPAGSASISVMRQGATNGTATVIFQTTTNGTAVLGTDYLAVSNLVTFTPGVVSNNVMIPIINNNLPEGNRTVTMVLSNALLVVTNGANLLLGQPAAATLTIVDTVVSSGQVMFATNNLVVTEANTNITVTVVRTNGSSGTIQVNYGSTPGTAQPGVDYTATSGTLTFGNGETVKTFNLPLLDNGIAHGAVSLTLTLSNPTGGASLANPTNLPVTILNNHAGVSFSSSAYVVNETNGSVTVTVLRQNVTSGTVQVTYATTNGTAVAQTNYVTTSGTLTFNPGETNKSVIVPVIHDPRATGNLAFGMTLSNPTGGAQLIFPSTNVVVLLDAEAGIGFTNSNFTVAKNGTNVLLTVFCTNPNVEPVSVNFATADGTAVAGTDYTSTSGVLTFTNGITTNYILVPIINNSLVEGNVNFTVNLSNPTSPAQLITSTNATVTILDVNAGFSFSSPTYTVLKNGVAANITVLRTGYTNSTASVSYTTQDGTGTNGVDYNGVSGTFVFTNGQTAQSFSVPVIDSTTVKPDKTVLLQLFNPAGTNGVLVAPSAAVLTIHDNSGSLIVPAGTALTSESGPVNGAIDPGETVTLLFGLRNGGGTNTANLTATLLATNGITAPSAAQNYGALLVNGPSASRPYSFIANGSNGQPIVATFLLTNGIASAGSVTFTFILGSSTISFTNGGTITIPTNGAASPYPSTLNVSGVGGSLTKATATLYQLYHTSSSDVDILLVSPTGQKTLLMANAGGFNAMNAATLNFDDAAATYLPQNGLIVSGTNKPSPYFPVTVFPAPAPASPYTTNMSAFSGNNPNGVWSLYVMDDTPLNSGMISNGWALNLTTVNIVGANADLVLNESAPSSVILGNNLTYTLAVTNYGPSTATGVTLTNMLPSGVTLVSSNASVGVVTSAAGRVTWTIGTLAMNAGASLTLVVNPTAAGNITNSCVVVANEADPNTADNSASLTTLVVTPTADLALALADAPDPLYNGNNITYTITVTNAGPATAPGVSITDTLPASVAFVSAAPTGYILSGNTLTFTNLGSLAVGAQTVASIVVKTTAAGLITDLASTASLVTDPFKANNAASVKSEVDLLQLGAVKSGVSLVMSWPTNTAGYVLESTPNLNPPAVWTTVTSPSAVVSNGQYVITISIGSGSKYFRLHGP